MNFSGKNNNAFPSQNPQPSSLHTAKRLKNTYERLQQWSFFLISNNDLCRMLNLYETTYVNSKHWLEQKQWLYLVIEEKKMSEVRWERMYSRDWVIVLWWWVKVGESEQVLDMKFCWMRSHDSGDLRQIMNFGY